MPDLIFVESNTTGSGMTALRTARRLGLRPVLLTHRPERYRGLTEAAPEVITCDTNSPAALSEALPRDDLAGITTTSEFYAVAVAELAAARGLPGNPPDAVRACRDKAALRRRLAGRGVPQTAFAVVSDAAAARAALGRVGLPCVVKPVDDTGSTNVRVCRTGAEASAQVDKILAVRTNVRGQPAAPVALVERFVDGPEYSIEMFSVAGRAVCLGIVEKTVTAPPYCAEVRHVYPAGVPAAVATELTGMVSRVLTAAGIRDGATHTEVRRGTDGCSVIEVNCRPAGGMIPELIRLVDGVDILEQQLRWAAGLPVDLTRNRRGAAGIQFVTAAETGVLEDVRGVAEARTMPGVCDVTVTASAGAEIRPPRSAYDRLGYVIARGAGPAEVATRLAGATARLAVTAQPIARRPELVDAGGGS